MAAELKIIQGDATKPEHLGEVPIIIPHCCNDIAGGAWGKGFVLGLNKAFGIGPKEAYHEWASGGAFIGSKNVKISGGYKLGAVQFVKLIEPSKTVIANMIAQRGVGLDWSGRSPIRYGALSRAMVLVKDFALTYGASIHMPRFGSGLAGGNAEAIEALVRETWVDYGIDVTIYDFPNPTI